MQEKTTEYLRVAWYAQEFSSPKYEMMQYQVPEDLSLQPAHMDI